MKNFIYCASVAAAALATPALAQESSGLRPYAGVLVGLDNVVLNDGTSSESKSGVGYGITLGVDTTVGANSRLGLEAELMDSSTAESEYLDADNNARLSADRDLFLGARAGVMITPRILGYVKAGYTNARVTLSGVLGGTPFSYGTNLDGYRIGAGVEYGNRVRARLEYRYSDYGDAKYQGVSLGVSAKRHQLLAGLVYGF